MALKIEVYGITLFVAAQTPVASSPMIVFPDGRKPRASVNDGSIIETHQPFIAFERGAYEIQPGPLSPLRKHFSFEFQIDGGASRAFDAWLLDGHVISVLGPEAGEKEPRFTQKTRVFSMRSLRSDLVLCGKVAAFACNGASGWIDVSTAIEVGGEAEGGSGGGILIQDGESELRIANRFTLHYDDAPFTVVRVAKGTVVESFTMTGTGPWTVMAGNVPLDQLFGAGSMSDAAGAPLTHVELVYDLYNVGDGPRPVPRFARGHEHTMTVASGLCGPGVQDGGGG